MNFTKIGAGWNTKGKTSGKPYIAISLDLEKFKLVYPEDYKKLSLFKNDYKKEDKQPDYILTAPTKEV